jgi:hypothetical protein
MRQYGCQIKRAPAMLAHPEARPIRSQLMDKSSVAYVLCRIEDDSSLTPVSNHDDLLNGVAAGGYAVEVEDFDFSYALYSGDTRVASFAEGRIGYRAWATRTGRISPSLEDRFDHDEDMLLA